MSERLVEDLAFGGLISATVLFLAYDRVPLWRRLSAVVCLIAAFHVSRSLP